MNTYKHVLNLAKDLQEEFGNKITLVEALQIAAQIHQTEVLSEGLLVRGINQSDSKPVALEAIAMTLGYTEKNGFFAPDTIIDAIRDKE